MRLSILLALAAFIACGGDSAAPGDATTSAAPAASVESDVEAAVRKHLSRRSDLDMSAMDMTIQDVEVQGETAVATVGFEVKGTPESAMSMHYNLAKEAGEWVVQANQAGHGGAPPPAAPSQGLPPGHPPAGHRGRSA